MFLLVLWEAGRMAESSCRPGIPIERLSFCVTSLPSCALSATSTWLDLFTCNASKSCRSLSRYLGPYLSYDYCTDAVSFVQSLLSLRRQVLHNFNQEHPFQSCLQSQPSSQYQLRRRAALSAPSPHRESTSSPSNLHRITELSPPSASLFCLHWISWIIVSQKVW